MTSSVSTHVLDTAAGRPAEGIRVELYRGGELVAWGDTNADGRIPELAVDVAPGTYELVFHPPSRFFQRVAFEVVLEAGHHHIPLLVSPYGCASYRGS